MGMGWLCKEKKNQKRGGREKKTSPKKDFL